MSERLEDIAIKMVAEGKGILAADESTGTIKKRFDSIKVENTEENRRDYREMMFSADEAMKNYVSGVILFDETLRQKAKDGTPFVDMINAAGAVPGIKVDAGAQDLAGFPGEKITEGLDGLRGRLKEYHGLGARFAKWRAVITIGDDGRPSWNCIHANAQALARYAALCQEQKIVPIVEPEVLMDGPDAKHTIDRCYEVTVWTLQTVFHELFVAGVKLEGMVLKPNMVVPGQHSGSKASVEEVAREDGEGAEGDGAARGSRHRLPLRRPVRRGGDRASFRDERDVRPALDAHLLLRPRAAGGGAEGVGRQGGERQGRRRPPSRTAPR